MSELLWFCHSNETILAVLSFGQFLFLSILQNNLRYFGGFSALVSERVKFILVQT